MGLGVKWGPRSFYGNVVQYRKGHCPGEMTFRQMCSGIFLMVSLTVGIKEKRQAGRTTVPRELRWAVGALQGPDASM